MNMLSRRELPSGYRYADIASIGAEEAIDLWRRAEFVADYVIDETALAEWDEAMQSTIVFMGVRDGRRRLVGMGAILGDVDLGNMSNLAVDPEHRHQGIGRTLVRERVKAADRLGIGVLDTHLMPSNTLRSLYIELGFRALGLKAYDLRRIL